MHFTPFSMDTLREHPHLGTTSLGAEPRIPAAGEDRPSVRRRSRRRRFGRA